MPLFPHPRMRMWDFQQPGMRMSGICHLVNQIFIVEVEKIFWSEFFLNLKNFKLFMFFTYQNFLPIAEARGEKQENKNK